MAERALTEVEVANALGFSRFTHFQSALKKGLVPGPDFVFPDGPRWSETRVDAWLNGDVARMKVWAEEKRLVERLERGDNAPPPRARKAGR